MVNNQNSGKTNQGQPAEPVQEQPGAPVSETQTKTGPVILIVEDDPVLSRMYSEKFKHEGFQVLQAYDGESGLKMALEEKINIVLLDIMLPKLSGTDLLEKMRADPRGKDILVVALTNLAEQNEKERALKYGVKEYLVKAMQTPEQVIQKIKQYVS